MVSSLRILAEEHNQRLTVNVADGVSVTADRLVLREAITNVVDNAIKHGPQTSTIDIRVRAHGNQALLTVADEGPGIGLDRASSLSSRFRATRSRRLRRRDPKK